MLESKPLFRAYLGFLRKDILKHVRFWWDMVLGIILVLASFLLQVHWKLVDFHDRRVLWIASYVIPFLFVLILDFIYRLVVAPWHVYQNQEKIYLKADARAKELGTKLSNCDVDLNRALASPLGPDIVFEFAAREQLRIRNLKGGAAHNISIHSFTNGVSEGMIFREHQLAFLAEGESQDFRPHIESILAAPAIAFYSLDAFVNSAHRKQPDNLEMIFPFTITFWDGVEKDFTCEYDMRHNFLTKARSIVRTKKIAALRRM